jgi:hypothetical protein
MKAYVVTTGVLFALLTLAHLWRIAAENSRLAAEPDFVLITLASAALCAWSVAVFRRLRR